MVRKLAMAAAFALLAFGVRQAGAAGLALDRTQTLDQILADCDPSTGLPHGVIPPATQGPRRKVAINPDWLRRPGADAYAAAYPAAAKSAHLSGQAIVRCLVGTDGHPHDCEVAQETPAGMGFGDAARQLAEKMLFVPKRVDCQAVDGGAVSIPLNFKVG